jgi:hypothetical protein
MQQIKCIQTFLLFVKYIDAIVDIYNKIHKPKGFKNRNFSNMSYFAKGFCSLKPNDET